MFNVICPSSHSFDSVTLFDPHYIYMLTRFSASTASSSSTATVTPPAISLVNDEMLSLASEIHSDVSNLIRSYSADRDRLKAAMEQLEYQVHDWETIVQGWGRYFQKVS